MNNTKREIEEWFKEFKRHNIDATISCDIRQDIRVLDINTSNHDTKVRAEMLEEVIKAIDESNYCMLEDCPFYKHCGYHLCPLDSNGLTIIQNWLEKWMEQLKEQKK